MTNLKYNDGSRTVFISTESADDRDLNENLKRFVKYLRGGTPEGVLANRIDEAIKRAKSQQRWRKEYMMLEDIYEDIKIAAREAGLEEGREAGLEEGREAGRIQALEETAGKLKAAGVEVALISQCTGLTREEIAAL